MSGPGAAVRATGIGSWPGTSVREAVRTVRDLLVDGEGVGLPHLPETPAGAPGPRSSAARPACSSTCPSTSSRAGGGSSTGRGATPRARHPCCVEDLDELAEAYDGYAGPLKVQVAGPWTLAASLRLNRGERLVSDAGAVADLVASLAAGVAGYVSDVRRLVPGAEVVLQVDEPSLPAVLEGSLPTSSGFGRVRAVDPQVVMRGVESVLAAHDGPTVVHCCSPSAPLPLLRATGAGALAIDLTAATPARWESVAATLDAGTGICVPGACRPTDRAPTPAPGPSCSRGSSARGWGPTPCGASSSRRPAGSPRSHRRGPAAFYRTALDTARRLAEEVEA